MARDGYKRATGYFSPDEEYMLNSVVEHYGSGYTLSGIVKHLFQAKYNEINDGATRRETSRRVEQKVDRLSESIERLLQILEPVASKIGILFEPLTPGK